jgi:hypothetical protein
MTDEQERTALALQREIQHTRAEVVADIDRLRDAVRERVSLRYILQTHPRLTQVLSLALGVAGVTTLLLLWRATAGRRDAAR